jgi:hypothetical protein
MNSQTVCSKTLFTLSGSVSDRPFREYVRRFTEAKVTRFSLAKIVKLLNIFIAFYLNSNLKSKALLGKRD